MAKPLVIQVIEEQRAGLLAHEEIVMRAMAERWLQVENALRADMMDLAFYLDELRQSGQIITIARLMQMERYQALIADARREEEQYAAWLAQDLASDQRALVGQGIMEAQDLITAALASEQDAGILSLAFNRINVTAVNYMAGFAADGTPLYELLRESYPESVLALTDNLVTGLAKGVGPRATAAAMAEDMAGNLDRALLIARTEQLRALRTGSLEQMRQSNVVSGYIRRAQRNATVCGACLALDGTEVESADPESFASHPNCQCYAQPKLTFGKTPAFQSGQDWFEEQPENVQEQILGPGKFELYQNGELDWGNLARVVEDPVWGMQIRQGDGTPTGGRSARRETGK
jgi:hypothetical protein